jgi:hypothetical protein
VHEYILACTVPKGFDAIERFYGTSTEMAFKKSVLIRGQLLGVLVASSGLTNLI